MQPRNKEIQEAIGEYVLKIIMIQTYGIIPKSWHCFPPIFAFHFSRANPF